MANADFGGTGIYPALLAARLAQRISAGPLLRLVECGGQRKMATHSGLAGLESPRAAAAAPRANALSPLRQAAVLDRHIQTAMTTQSIHFMAEPLRVPEGKDPPRAVERCCLPNKKRLHFPAPSSSRCNKSAPARAHRPAQSGPELKNQSALTLSRSLGHKANRKGQRWKSTGLPRGRWRLYGGSFNHR